MKCRTEILKTGFVLGITFLFANCASTHNSKEDQDNTLHAAAQAAASQAVAAQDQKLNEMKAQIASMEKKVTAMETKIDTQMGGFNEKMDGIKASMDILMGIKKPKTEAVGMTAVDSRGVPVDSASGKFAAGDLEAGFLNDNAVKAYRQAMLLESSKKYAEAILAFSAFLERYADHALAGSAQFHIGECYFQQKEYQLAANEYSRVLTSYDRSPHVADALKRLTESHLASNKSDEALKSKQLLVTLFALSPAAAGMNMEGGSGQPGATATQQAATPATGAEAQAGAQATAEANPKPTEQAPAEAPAAQQTADTKSDGDDVVVDGGVTKPAPVSPKAELKAGTEATPPTAPLPGSAEVAPTEKKAEAP
ncbi:MAG: tetratricopeptide repeat protein [Bdellovibrionales bacterium]|nr:tetratricopeptide repeat protein [Bdellovibrionales bacterium]